MSLLRRYQGPDSHRDRVDLDLTNRITPPHPEKE